MEEERKNEMEMGKEKEEESKENAEEKDRRSLICIEVEVDELQDT